MQSLPLQIEGTGIRLEPDASETIAVPGSLCRKECSPVKCTREAYRHHLASDVFSNKTDPGAPGRRDAAINGSKHRVIIAGRLAIGNARLPDRLPPSG